MTTTPATATASSIEIIALRDLIPERDIDNFFSEALGKKVSVEKAQKLDKAGEKNRKKELETKRARGEELLEQASELFGEVYTPPKAYDSEESIVIDYFKSGYADIIVAVQNNKVVAAGQMVYPERISDKEKTSDIAILMYEATAKPGEKIADETFKQINDALIKNLPAQTKLFVEVLKDAHDKDGKSKKLVQDLGLNVIDFPWDDKYAIAARGYHQNKTIPVDHLKEFLNTQRAYVFGLDLDTLKAEQHMLRAASNANSYIDRVDAQAVNGTIAVVSSATPTAGKEAGQAR